MSREIKFRLWDGERYWYNVAPLNNIVALTQELADVKCPKCGCQTLGGKYVEDL